MKKALLLFLCVIACSLTSSAVGPITGSLTTCVGSSTVLFDSSFGGHWGSSDPSVVTIDSVGVATGVSVGTAVITYALSPTDFATAVMTVNPAPPPILGLLTVCLPGGTALSNTASGGFWTSSTPSVATVGITSGIVTGVAVGTARITYALTTGCFVTAVVTVGLVPDPIIGAQRMCVGSSITLSDATPGGSWSSSAPTVATIGSAGIVNAVSVGVTTISYTVGGCSATKTVTVGAMPAPISGPSSLCVGATITLTDATSGGTWFSGNPAIASVDSATGVVTGVAGGVVNITYSTGCHVFKTITVNAAPAAISGSATICLGSTSTYASASPGGIWSSGSPTIVSINSAGVATALGLGAAILTYTLPTGCFTTTPVTVTTSSAVISGLSTVCAGATVTWVATPPGGTWSSANPTVAMVGSTGIVTGFTAGTAMISYSLGGCATSQVVTVTAGPSVISGAATFCAGSTSLYTSAPAGGTWSTANPAVATINPASGLATGVSAGFTFITYTLPSGCFAVKTVTVTSTTASISGASAMCQVGSTTFLGFPSGGTWISGSPSIATIGFTSGIITGVAPGTTTMTYTVGGCFATKAITVNPTPQPVIGPDTVCLSSTASYTSATPGGTWSVGVAPLATISASGVLTPLIVGGPLQVIYTAPTGCMSGKYVYIVSGSAAISGGSSVCAGGTLSLVATPPGGMWSSSNPLVATVGSTGVVSGLTPGVVTISYSMGGCATTKTVTVTAAPSTIVGGSTVCAGGSVTLSNSTPGGTWSVSSTAIATISASGVLTGVSPGSVVVTYSIGSCFTTAFVTVTPGPGPITGAGSICAGATLTLSNATPGGFWTSGNGSVASVDGVTGVVTGIASGTATISYTAGGCTVTTVVTVSSTPATISGPSSVCTGAAVTYTNAVPGGSWSVSSTSVATIGATSGVLTGIATGVVTISYSVGGCLATKTVTVTATPAPIAGPSSVCVGATITLTNAAAGGTWTSATPTRATVDAATGVVTGVSTGIATIQYTTSCGTVSKTVSVNAAPSAITGVSSLCVGTTSTFTTSTTGGVWSSSNTALATITSTGLVTAVSPGVVTISYTKSGCSATKSLTINAVPGPIMGSNIVCVGSTITLTNSVPGGTWASGNPLKATVDAATGVVTGVATGTLNVYYSIGGCITSKALTVNASPSDIIGPSTLCAGTTITLASLTTGGTWSSSNTAIATVTTTGGLVNGVSAGVVTISYTKSGCSKTKSVTVNATPGPISGSSTVCVGSSITLTNTVPGGTWTSSNTSRATVDASGVVTGVSNGVVTITYATPCGSTTKTVTVNAALPAISGTTTLCAGGTTILSNTVSGGTWTSGNTAVATVNTAGVVTGVSAGTAMITYAVGGCSATITVTVNAGPAPITGGGSICVSGSLTLSSATPGGSWTSSNTSVATVSASGVVSGVAVGTATITYTLATGCAATTVVTVTAGPSPISGSPTLCVGGTTTLTSSPTGGMWSSSAPSIAAVGSSTGVVSGVAPGVAIITYSISGCSVMYTVSVSTSAAPITGPSTVCAGSTATYTNGTIGGVWLSSNVAVANIDSVSGVLTANTAGVVVITYLTGGCNATMSVTVSAGPSAITGTASVCVGNTTMLSSTPSGGTWTSGNLTVATVGVTSGIVVGVAPGTAMITYSLGTGCSVTRVVTVSTAAGPISGPSTVCTGGTITLTSGSTGGTWTSSNPAIASVGSTGVVTGNSTGVVIITYSNGGCSATKSVTVSAGPSVISGTASVCAGSTTLLTSTPGGGMWTSSNPAVATVGSTVGLVAGVTPGTAMITYSIAGCFATRVVTVNAGAGPITGTASVCVGGSTTLSGATTGGVWLSSNPTIASVDSATGVVTGNATGVVSITYIVGGCFASRTVTVTPGPPAIGGPSAVCAGSTIVLTNSVPGGMWSSSNTAVAAVTPTAGIVFGVTPGTATITYTVGSCSVTKTVTVITAPAPITGSSTVCAGSSTALSSATPGGVWSSSNSAVAAVGGTTGVVTGVSAGAAVITYSIGGCFITFSISVSPAPAPITGPSSVCIGSSILLTDPTPGGVWSSSSPSTATVSMSGMVTGLSSGVVTITYSVGGCSVTKLVTVNATPSAIIGASSVCTGATTVFTNAVPGGVWTSSNPSVAAVGPTSGVVTGITAGAAVITYSIGGCFAVKTIGVSPGPSAITGPSSVCVGSSVSLSSAPGGGVWSSSNIAIASVSPSGLLTAVGPGVVTITYSRGGCDVTKVVSVNNTPAPIMGGSSVCAGSTMVLTNSVPGGVWTSSSPTVAAVSTSGVVTGVSAGGAIITYAIGSCFVVRTVAVIAAPAPIVGGSNICIGTPLILSDATPGGAWSVSNPSIAIVSGTGIVNGIAPGAVTVSYTVGGCSATKAVTVNQTPSAISGPTSVCAGSSVTFTNTVPSGAWTSSNGTIASVSIAGVVTGNASGVATITYAIGGCIATKAITVNAVPGPISGAGSVCVGAATTYTNPVGGGVWTSSATPIATVGVTTGVVSGVSAGTAVITYSIGSCFTVRKLIVFDCGTFGIGKETAVEDVKIAPVFSVFPNPASGYINISWDSEIGSADIVLSDVAGREVSRISVDGKANGTQRVDVANLADGMYMLSVKSETAQHTSRIIIRR